MTRGMSARQPTPLPGARDDRHPHPLVYSCSGCSNVAQLANTLAVRLDRAGLAESPASPASAAASRRW